MSADYEYAFDPEAENNTASSVYRMALEGGPRILDLGSGPGIVAGFLQQGAGRHVTCVDRSAALLSKARKRGVKRTIEADISDRRWLAELVGEQFDVVILADVLEHLIDPGALLDQIVGSGILAAGGFLVISIPNAGHEAVIGELIAGRFTYQETGLLDSTHLRFFTLASLRELLESRGLFVTRIERTKRTAEQTTLSASVAPPALRQLLAESVPELHTFQFIIRAEPADAARELGNVRRELERLRGELDSARSQPELALRIAELETALADGGTELAGAREIIRDQKQRLVDTEASLLRERERTEAERMGREKALREIEALRRAVEKTDDDSVAKKKVARLQRELGHVYRSRTWRAGRVLWHVYHFPGRVLRGIFTGSEASGDESPEPVPDSYSEDVASSSPAPAEYVLTESTVMRRRYEDALSRNAFSDPDSSRNVVMAVYTVDLDAGRGDVYSAVGLGRHLERIGYEVLYLPQDRWYDLPEGTSIYVAMLDWVEPSRVPPAVKRVAWVRNRTAFWAESPSLPFYDMVLCSSGLSRAAIQRVYPGPTGVLPLAVDAELFAGAGSETDRVGVVATTSHWGTERSVHRFLSRRAPDYPLALYGQDRGISSELKPYVRGAVPFFALPSLYSQATVVLDDLMAPNAPFGNTNSRVFEALASGAVVLTNQVRGLDEIGLEALAVYRDANELHTLIHNGLAGGELCDHAKRLRQIVLEQHTYAIRAEQFARLVDQLGSAVAGNGSAVVGFYPDYRNNSYQEMMWAVLRAQSMVPVPIDDSFDASSILKARGRRRVLHLNWTAPILGPATSEADRLGRYRRFISMLDECAANGVPSIWTVHNVLPHECADPHLEGQLRQEIADRVDLIHVMCDATVSAAAPHYEIPASKVRVLPHPAYIDVYPSVIDQDTARYELGLHPDEMVYLFLGKIRHYKGVDLLLDAFDRLHQVRPRSRLMIAGAPGRFPDLPMIEQRARAHPAILANFNEVPDSDLQVYLAACDVVVLPYRSGLNSGATMLAYSFARPVIVAAEGCMADQVDPTTGIVFSWKGGGNGLLAAMLDGERLRDRNYRVAAYERAAASHYLEIATGFSELVEEAWTLRSG